MRLTRLRLMLAFGMLGEANAPGIAPQNVLALSLDNASLRLSLNEYTDLPTAVDHSGPATRSDCYEQPSNFPGFIFV